MRRREGLKGLEGGFERWGGGQDFLGTKN